jgi:hypothetical protein
MPVFGRWVGGAAANDPSALLFAGDTPYAVVVLELTPDGSPVCGIYSDQLTAPSKRPRPGRAWHVSGGAVEYRCPRGSDGGPDQPPTAWRGARRRPIVSGFRTARR